jgi:hypothetical protein
MKNHWAKKAELYMKAFRQYKSKFVKIMAPGRLGQKGMKCIFVGKISNLHMG